MSVIDKFKNHKLDAEKYFDFRHDISRYNLNTLQQISFVGGIGGALLVIASSPPVHLLNLFHGYLALDILFITVFILTITLLKKNSKAILPVYYAFLVMLLTISIVLGTYHSPNANATTFVMLMIVTPMFIIDKPSHIVTVTGIMSVIFCVIVAFYKTGDIRNLDIANCIVFYLLSTVICKQVVYARMSDIIIKNELKHQRDIDMLTNLSNRGAFERVVASYIHESNQNAVMIIMDIDNFKSVNDTFGHARGDMVLQTVSEYLHTSFRTGDTVSRLGGDEFVVFLPNVTDLKKITDKVDNLIERISNICVDDETPCNIGASVGIAQYPENGCSFEDLYKHADSALYSAKQNGKGRYVIYENLAN